MSRSLAATFGVQVFSPPASPSSWTLPTAWIAGQLPPRDSPIDGHVWELRALDSASLQNARIVAQVVGDERSRRQAGRRWRMRTVWFRGALGGIVRVMADLLPTFMLAIQQRGRIGPRLLSILPDQDG